VWYIVFGIDVSLQTVELCTLSYLLSHFYSVLVLQRALCKRWMNIVNVVILS
jgi:hypothetical protein